MFNISFVFLVRIVSLVDYGVGYLEIHVLLFEGANDFKATSLLIDVKRIPLFLVGVCQLSILVAIRCVKLCRRTFRDQNDLTCTSLHKNAAATFVYSSVVAEEAFFVILSGMASARPVLNLEPAHGFAAEKTGDAILSFFITVSALFLVV